MKPERPHFREEFWENPPALPPGVELVRQEGLVVPRTGPGGESAYDLAEVRLSEAKVPVLLSYRAPLFPAQVVAQKDKLQSLREQLRLRESDVGKLPTFRVPMLVTDSASPRVVEACANNELALVDQRGTFFLRAGSTFIRIQGSGSSSRVPREPVFHGKGSRIVRVLLKFPGRRWTVRALSDQTQTSYTYAHGVIKRLTQEGLVDVSGGVRLREPVGLLKTWMKHGRPTAISKEGFNAPSTTPDVLDRGYRRLESQGIRSIFSLASGLEPDERFVSGLPHGLYLSGSLERAIDAFGLRRMTPYNFWILRADPAAETEVGGVYFGERSLAHGPGVSLPQLAVDFQHSGGRGEEQADELLRRFAKSLPLVEELE
ncbi:hypothetical protein LXT21_31515 [Myxococcus sp. K38C18041901]|uniref:hypothetical protein n=1 Tax=Myxococcus guangdongensis TaxID=2906760 RepID=UPI0020A6F0F8|nr:hypothetical protein [Myxococcus guangdongensis]MCP3063317.1 hypothetical protein [Myxococcus guangdongensis]